MAVFLQRIEFRWHSPLYAASIATLDHPGRSFSQERLFGRFLYIADGAQNALCAIEKRRQQREAVVQQAKRSIRGSHPDGLFPFESHEDRGTPEGLELQVAAIELTWHVSEIRQQKFT